MLLKLPSVEKMKAKLCLFWPGVGRIEYSHNTTGSNPLLTVRLNSLEYPRTPPGQLKLTDRHFFATVLENWDFRKLLTYH